MSRVSGARIAVATMMFETNSFAPGVTGLDAFQRQGFADGADVLTIGGGLDSVAGAVEIARGAGVHIVPTTAAMALSGPTVAVGVYPYLRDRIIDGIDKAGAVDGVYLSLHGAMVAEDVADTEGDVLTHLRELVGPDVPIAISLDLHTHFTQAMADAGPLVAGYHTLPHVDIKETGARAMTLLLAALDGQSVELGWRKVAMITPPEPQDTRHPPMKLLMDRVHEMRKRPGVLEVSLFATQPWLDVPELGWSPVVLATDAVQAQEFADELAAECWAARAEFTAPKVPIAEAIARAESLSGPVILGDGADSPSAGSVGDGVEVLAGLIDARPAGRCLVIVTDAAAAERCHQAGVGAHVSLEVGGSIATQFHRPVLVEGRVDTLNDGRYQSLYPPAPADVGPTAIIHLEPDINVVVTSFPASQLDDQLYRHLGLDPRDASIAVTKSAGGYRAFFEPFATECIDVDTTGPSDARLERMPFSQVDRPLYPLDPELTAGW